MDSIFQSSNPHGNIVLNFHRNPVDELPGFAKGYHDAAKRLTKVMENSISYPDYDGYPIVFLYRHSLELYLKTIIYRGVKLCRLMDENFFDTSKLFSNHNLISLFEGVELIFKSMDWSWDVDLPGLSCHADFQRVITEFNKIDPGSYNFRYPINTKGEAPLAHHTMINVIKLSKTMDQLFDLFDGAILQLGMNFQLAVEEQLKLMEIINE